MSDSTTRDTNTAWPKPDASRIELAQRAIVEFWENATRPDMIIPANLVTAAIWRQGHTLRVADWAVRGMIKDGRLNASFREDLLRPCDWQNLSDLRVCPTERFFEPTAAPPDHVGKTSVTISPAQDVSAKLSERDLATKHDVNYSALRKRLGRWRFEHDTGYAEVANPRKNEPKYLYDESAVMPIIADLKAKAESQKRAANGQQKKN